MPVVRRNEFEAVCELLAAHRGPRAADTETTGLEPYKKDRLFSLIITTSPTDSYYFNFQPYPDVPEEWVLPRAWLKKLAHVFAADPEALWYLSNAKFDLAMLRKEGIEVGGKIHDTEAIGRVVQNNLFQYGIDALAAQIGLRKSKAVEEYILKHGLYTDTKHPLKKEKTRRMHFELVPFNIMAEYGQNDGVITFAVGEHQRKRLIELNGEIPRQAPGSRPILDVYENEMELTRTCFEMEWVGIKIDRAYCERMLNQEVIAFRAVAEEFRQVTGMEFVDSGKCLSQAFTKMGEKFPLTEKGNPSFTDDVLEGFTTPVAKLVQRYRASYKLASTYYSNFIDYADAEEILHANNRQGGTETGRMSMSEPNLQNIPKVDEDDPEKTEISRRVKKAFRPRDGFFLCEIDLKQAEYRLMLDYAGQMDVIEAVIGGLDVHGATAQIMDCTRFEGKTINFALLYGAGVAKLAKQLGCSFERAKALKEQYFAKLPQVRDFIRNVIKRAEARGWLVNWFGRRSLFSFDFCYKSPNSLIQGGIADMAKIAMNRCARFLRSRLLKSRLLLQVHDSLLFEISNDEAHIIPELLEIMCRSYPHRLLPMAGDVKVSRNSWGEMEKWHGPTTGDTIQKQDAPAVAVPA